MSERAKLSLLSFLLLLILGCLAFTAVRALQAVHNFQQQYSGVKAGDVSTMRPWMTVHVISHVYHVPENYLYHSLTINNPAQLRHATLYLIANSKRQTIDQVIRTAQDAVLAYRKQHPTLVTPALIQHRDRDSLLPILGRTTY
ncbi:MAG TPA: hypothetical protein VGL94_07540 [Ktedonobacteraceae bacterium]